LGEPLDVVKQTVVGYGQLSESEPLSQHFLPVPGEQSAAPARPGIKQTVLGVAVPGVAPVHPGAETSYPSRAGAAVQQLGGTALSDAELAFLPGRRRRGRQALWIAATAAILAIVLSGLVVLFLRRGATRVEARVSVDALGNERLDVSCEDCATGTQVALGSRSAKFNAKRAILELNVPLIVGENKLTLGLRSPGSSQEEKVEILVPVQYRVRGDLEGLNETPPKLRVLARAVPGTTIVMDGKAIAQAANGSAVYDLDVGTALTGQSAQVASLERRIPYTITPSGAPPHRDEVRFQLSIVPLIVRAPGESVVIDSASFMLVGQTLKGASVSVAGRPIEVDAQGSFTQLMSVSAVGETVILVRASAPERAPRLVPIRVKRVERLTEEAKKFRENATVSYQTIASDIAGKRGVPVAWVAGVVEARVEDHTSILLVDVRSGCDSPPCLARVVLGKKSDFSSGQLVTVFGAVSGGVAGPRSGTEIPELHADFILPGQN
jgi:hypothetical protein